MPPARQKPMLSVARAAEMLGIPKRTLYEWCRTGKFPHLRLGRKVLVSRETVEGLLAPGVVPSSIVARVGKENLW
jgi:excisionase family DNA binding protein